ncbi:hypothetical protein MBLNU459_g3028t2 [Dothideomycetes sp. NU459]
MPTVFAVDDRQDPNRTSDLDAKVLDVQRHAFDQSDFPEMRQTSMADMSLRRNTCYNQGTSQQDQMPRLPSAHTYPSTDFSPLHDFPPVTSHQKMSAQVYDPQLVAMDHQTTSSDVMMDAFNPPTSGSNIDDTYPGMLQFWLSQADSEFGYASLDMPDISQSPFGTYQTYPPDPVQSIPGPSAPSEISDGTTTVSSVPNERLSRVESAWVANTGRPLRFTPTLWHDIKQSPGANLFSQSSASTSRSDVSKSESRWGIDSSLKQRLEMEFGTSSSNFPQSGKDNSFPRPSNLAFPPPEVLDISLDVYFRRFHPIAPFVHVPTFSAGSAPLPLLYAMCILGLNHWDRHDHLIPWKCFKDDLRGRSLVPVTLSLSPCVTASPKTTDLNSLVLWHNICMTLNANIQIFELAAGRRGAGRAGKALADVVDWSQTPAARRACIHAAQVFKLLAGRKVSESITLNALTALFHAALVLGLYLFSVPREESNNTANSGPMFEILDEVDWITVGDSGMSDRSSEENQDVLFNPTQFPDPATAFIELGGNISIGGVPSLPGYASSRTTLLEYANVMDGMGAWKPRTLSRILHIMSDVLEETT